MLLAVFAGLKVELSVCAVPPLIRCAAPDSLCRPCFAVPPLLPSIDLAVATGDSTIFMVCVQAG